MIHKNKDFRTEEQRGIVKNKDKLVDCMCAQYSEKTVFPGLSILWVEGGNYINCNFEEGVTFTKPALVIKKRYCHNIHPEAPFEKIDCIHSIFHEEYSVDDDILINSYYTYDEDQLDENKNPKFITYRHIKDGKVVDGRKP
jgi:hypothetical protein